MNHLLVSALKQLVGSIEVPEMLTVDEVKKLKRKMEALPEALNGMESDKLDHHEEKHQDLVVMVFEIGIQNPEYYESDPYYDVGDEGPNNFDDAEVEKIVEKTLGDLAKKVIISAHDAGDKGWFAVRVEFLNPPDSPIKYVKKSKKEEEEEWKESFKKLL